LEQTYDALSDTHHPYRKALNQYFNNNVEILKVDEARNIQKGSLNSNATIIISTFASWRVDKTEGRKVYEQNGSLSSHLERQEFYSFWLQTSTDKFYPDFIAKLTNGVIIVIEYKGTDRYNNDDSKGKRQLGDFYAGVSKGSCRFIMLNGKDWNALKNKLIIEIKVKYQ